MDTRETKIPEALSALANALQADNRKEISSALKSCKQILEIETTQEEICALAIVFTQTNAGTHPTSYRTLMCASKEVHGINIRWDLVLQSLEQKETIRLLSEQEINSDQSDCSITKAVDALQNAQVSLEQCSIILQPPFCDVVIRDCPPKGFASNREYIRACLEFLDAHIYYVQSHQEHSAPSSKALLAKYTHLRTKAQDTNPIPPLELLCKEYELEKTEWLIILLTLKNTLGGDTVNPRSAGEMLHGGDALERFDFQRYFDPDRALVGSGILDLEHSFRKDREDVSIQVDLLNWLIIGGTPPPAILTGDAYDDQCYKNNREYVSEWINLANSFLDIDDSTRPSRKHRAKMQQSGDPVCQIPAIRRKIGHLMAHGSSFPLGKLILKYGFDANECAVIAIALLARTKNADLPVQILTELLAGDDCIMQMEYESYFSAISPLLRSGLIEVTVSDREGPTVNLPKAVAQQIMEIPISAGGRTNFYSKLPEPRLPRHDLSSVILDRPLQRTIATALEATRSDTIQRLKRWGIEQITSTRPVGSLTMLLSGPPGTGKTYTAEGIAGTLGRDIIDVDVTDYLTKWYGETEQNLECLFRAYEDLCFHEEKVPVLLINEADKLFGQRQSVGTQATDMTEYRLQSLLLEHLERFSGILIATTNHVSSIDDAFSRRFDIKLEIPLPSAQLRLVLWEALIPATVPLAFDVNLIEISEKYMFTGGQIAVVVPNALGSAVLRGDHLTQEDIVRACQEEMKGSFDRSTDQFSRRRIGFFV